MALILISDGQDCSGTAANTVLISNLFIADGAADTVVGDDQIVYAGASSTINVAPGVTRFRLVQHPDQTPWGDGTTPTIVQSGTVLHANVVANLQTSQGDTVTMVSDGTTWYADVPAVGGAGGVDIDSYRHTQPAASDTWTIVHNLGRFPGGFFFQDGTGQDMEADNITHVNINTTTATFLVPATGTVDVS